MNALARLRPVLILAITALLAACATSPISRIDANRAAYESWPIDIQEAVLNGQVKQGMTADMVRTSVGRASEVINRGVNPGDDEVWVYRKGGSSSLLKNTGISIGGGIGGVGVSTGTSVGGGGGGPVEEEHEVFFQNGIVVRSDF